MNTLKLWNVVKRYDVLLRMFLVASLLLGTSACEGILEVDLPDRLEAERLDDPDLLSAMRTGMLADLECGFQGAQLTGAYMSGEAEHTGSGRINQVWVWRQSFLNEESHEVPCTRVGGVWQPLQMARFQAEDIYRRVQEVYSEDEVENREEILGEAATAAAYSTTLLTEMFCEMTFDAGPRQTRAQAFERAEEWFLRALSHSTSPDIRNWALVGLARTRLNLGDEAGAVEAASQVPEGFERLITTSPSDTRRENRIFRWSHADWDLRPHSNDWNLEVDGVEDPRTLAVKADHTGADGESEFWYQMKYTSLSDPIVMAGWREAKLIIAEVEGGSTAVDIINELRATYPQLPEFQSSDEEEIAAQVLEERRRELWLDGHRFGDLLRLGIPFPQGVSHRGEPYGSITCIPLPEVEEQTNPNL